jgi:hypothetical protein
MCVCVFFFCHVSIATDKHIKSLIKITIQQLNKQLCYSGILYVDKGTGDFLGGFFVSDVMVNNLCSVVRRLRASGAVTVLVCRWRK